MPASRQTVEALDLNAPYVEWSAVFAGAVVALAVAFVLLTFGSAVGLSAVSPWTSTQNTVTAVSIGAAFWMLIVHVWAFALGGYLAGRMRHRRPGAAPVEVDFRDGAHGAAVWGLAVTAGAIVAAMVAGAVVRGGVDLGASAARNISDPTSIAADALLRTTRNEGNRAEDTRAEMTRILTRSAGRGEVAAADRTYLAQLVAARTGLAPAEAEQRINETLTQMKQATDRARKTAVVFGFLTAATLMLAAAAAWWGATVGGRHRDDNTVWAGFARRSPSL
jgi:hypothetical protein